MIALLRHLLLLLVLSLTTVPLHAEDTEFGSLLAAAEQAVEAGQLSEAGEHYKHAIEIATKSEGQDSANAIVGRMGYLSLLIDLNKLDEAETLQGGKVKIEVKGDVVMINGAKVLKTDILCKNGVVHVIDAVLLPKE